MDEVQGLLEEYFRAMDAMAATGKLQEPYNIRIQEILTEVAILQARLRQLQDELTEAFKGKDAVTPPDDRKIGDILRTTEKALRKIGKQRKSQLIYEFRHARNYIYGQLAKHGEFCAFCQGTDHLQVDHKIPLACGGTNDFENMQLLCRRCNFEKGDRLLFAWLARNGRKPNWDWIPKG
jgi:5-methylcytosine-specific restriction endonuclease McrA